MRLAIFVVLGGCFSNVEPIVMPPPDRLPGCADRSGSIGCDSRLVVPMACPIFAPGDSDTDWRMTDQISVFCVVDEFAATYGTRTGSGPNLAVIPGSREIGVYVAFDPAYVPVLENLTVDGSDPTITAFAAPVNVDDPRAQLPEEDPANRIAVQMVAIGPTGMLLSLHHFNDSPVQVDVTFDHDKAYPGRTLWVLWNSRFYVNARPGSP